MVSLGTQAFCTTLIADNIQCTGSITAANKVFGASKNQGEMHHHGSIFYILWSAVHQVSSMATTSGSTNVHVTTTAPHGLAQGDTVHIGSLPNNPGAITEVNGVPASEIEGTHAITAAQSSTSFTIAVGANAAATASGTSTAATPLVRVDRYRFTDMNSSTATWQNSTTLPTPSHTNIELFYL